MGTPGGGLAMLSIMLAEEGLDGGMKALAMSPKGFIPPAEPAAIATEEKIFKIFRHKK